MSSVSIGYNGEEGREFLATGQFSASVVTLNPYTGGSTVVPLELQGRVGVLKMADSGQGLLYVDTENSCFEQELPFSKAMTTLEDIDLCSKFVTEALTEIILCVE